MFVPLLIACALGGLCSDFLQNPTVAYDTKAECLVQLRELADKTQRLSGTIWPNASRIDWRGYCVAPEDLPDGLELDEFELQTSLISPSSAPLRNGRHPRITMERRS